LANNVPVNQSEAAAARKFIAEQLPLTESSVRQGMQVCKFKEENNITDLAGRRENRISNYFKFRKSITKAG